MDEKDRFYSMDRIFDIDVCGRYLCPCQPWASERGVCGDPGALVRDLLWRLQKREIARGNPSSKAPCAKGAVSAIQGPQKAYLPFGERRSARAGGCRRLRRRSLADAATTKRCLQRIWSYGQVFRNKKAI